MVWCIREHSSFQQPWFQLHSSTGRYQRGREWILAEQHGSRSWPRWSQRHAPAGTTFLSHTLLPAKEELWYISVAFQLLAEVSQSWGVDPDSSWTTQWSSTRGMERDRGNSQYSIMQTVGNSKTIFLFVCSRFHFFNKDKRRDRSWEGKEVNCFDLTSVIRLMKCQSIQVRT